MGCSSLQLKLLSVQGDKSVCTIHQLTIQQQLEQLAPAIAASGTSSTSTAQPDAASTAVAAADLVASSGGMNAAAPTQQSLSQLDELRLLIQQLHQPGEVSSSYCALLSLQAAVCSLGAAHGATLS